MMSELPLPGMIASRTKTPLGVEVVGVYVVFITGALVVYHLVANGEFSVILTLSAIFQCLAFSLLGMQAFSSRGLEGISLWSLYLDALAIACRLSSTLFFEGYLPSDKTGDFLYQAIDILSLALVVGLAHKASKLQRETCDVEDKRLPVSLAFGALLLASLFHANLDDNVIFDTMWMYSTLLSAVAVLPQLWLMTHSRGSVPALTTHFIAMMALGRAISGLYMWHAHDEIECDPWVGKFNHAGFVILGAHVLHLLLLADFAYFYCKNVVTLGVQSSLSLPQSIVV
jgi:hypothetical protein